MADDRLRKVGDAEKRRVDRLIRYKKAHQRLEMTIDDLLTCPGTPRKGVK
jgi:hypothetical protein